MKKEILCGACQRTKQAGETWYSIENIPVCSLPCKKSVKKIIQWEVKNNEK